MTNENLDFAGERLSLVFEEAGCTILSLCDRLSLIEERTEVFITDSCCPCPSYTTSPCSCCCSPVS